MEAGASINLRWQMSGQCGSTILRFRVVEKGSFVECKGEIGRSSGIMRPSWSLEYFNGGGRGYLLLARGYVLCGVQNVVYFVRASSGKSGSLRT